MCALLGGGVKVGGIHTPTYTQRTSDAGKSASLSPEKRSGNVRRKRQTAQILILFFTPISRRLLTAEHEIAEFQEAVYIVGGRSAVRSIHNEIYII